MRGANNEAAKRIVESLKSILSTESSSTAKKGASILNGPDVLLKMKTLGYAIIKDYNKLRVEGSNSFESLFEEENKPTREQALFYDNYFPKPDGTVSNKKPQLDPMIF